MLGWSLWALLPLVFSTFTAVGLWAVYFIGVVDRPIALLSSQHIGNGSLHPPYISVVGNFPPASGIFSQVLNLSACMGFFISILRYLQLERRIQAWLNVASLVGLCITFLGLMFVGNFQLFNQNTMHNVGTSMAFVVGILVCWVQSYITLRADINNEGKAAAVARFLLSGSTTICVILYKILQSQDLHIQAAQCQWALAMSLLTFFATFAIEFRLCRFRTVCVEDCGHQLGVPETPL